MVVTVEIAVLVVITGILLGLALAVVRAFRDQLVDLGVNATVRRNRGTDIDAACGQLAAREGAVRVRP